MSFHFAYGREVLGADSWSITVNNAAGSLTAANKYFSLQGQNAIGKNTLLISDQIVITENSSVTISINNNALLESEGWTHYVIGISEFNDEFSFYQIARIPIYNYDNGDINIELPKSFPLDITFSTNSQIETAVFVQDLANLPTTDLVYGMMRGVTDLDNAIFEYNPFSTKEPNGTSIIEATLGNWIKKSDFLTYVGNIFGANGCARNVLTITDFENVEYLNYDADGNTSLKTKYYLLNDSNSTIQPNTGILPSIQLGGINRTELFENKLFYEVLGIVNTSTGELRTLNTITGLDLELIDVVHSYSKAAPYKIIADYLQPNEAILLEVYIRFVGIEFNNLLPSDYFQVNFSFVTPSGEYVAVGSLFDKGVIFNKYNKRRIYPGLVNTAVIGEGAGIVRNFNWYSCNTSVYNLADNEANQKLYVNINGAVFKDTAEKNDSVLRGIVDTTPKESVLSDWSSYLELVNNDAIQATVEYDFDSDLNIKIRSDYPDVIANDWSIFNATSLNIYIQRLSDGEIRKFENNLISSTNGFQDFVINNWNSGTVITTQDLPSVKSSFYNPVANDIAKQANIGDFVADQYRVAHSYVWNGTTISDISHNPMLGCITEASISGEDIFSATNTIKIPVSGTTTFLFDGLVLSNGVFLLPGQNYIFDLSDPNNLNTILSFSTVKNGTHNDGEEYTTNILNNGTPGYPGAYLLFKVPLDAPAILYPYDPTNSEKGGNSYFLTRATYVNDTPQSFEFSDWADTTSANDVDLGDWADTTSANDVDLGDWTP